MSDKSIIAIFVAYALACLAVGVAFYVAVFVLLFKLIDAL